MTNRKSVVTAFLALVFLFACGARTDLTQPPPANLAPPEPCGSASQTRACHSVCGDGVEMCVDDVWQHCTAPLPVGPPSSVHLTGTIRDLQDTHPDFEKEIGDDRGIVLSTLGPDQKPIYGNHLQTATTHGPMAFESWYHDTPNINLPIAFAIDLVRDQNAVYRYDSEAFFPIDSLLFGNEGRAHNYHFTFELHSVFLYRGGETFTFTGDDDMWLFLNKKLVVDLGGVHSSETQTVKLDSLGLTQNQETTFDFFFAERHTTGSTFHIETSIAVYSPCP